MARSRCCSCLCVALYLSWYWFVETTGLWSRFFEVDYECDHPALPANQSGLKVLVAGYAKSGTRSLSRALYQIGLDHSYHSEDVGMFLWARLADKFWLRRSGGSWSGLPAPAFTPDGDWVVMKNTSSEDLAAAVSRCRADAIAFDGIEQLFWPMYNVSADAKVILLNWRTFAEWRKSLEDFVPLLLFEIVALQSLSSSLSVLPWGALFRVVDPLVGRRLEELLRSGGPPICQVYDVYTSWWHQVTAFRRIVQRWLSGLSHVPETEEDYWRFLNLVKYRVPPEKLFEWDMRRHRFEDLCQFLGIDPCPKRGGLPRVINSFSFQRDHPSTFFGCLPLLLFLHFLNWKILSAVLSVVARLVRGKPKVQ